jgi:ribosomal-protein-alanine N-acetyltransferase
MILLNTERLRLRSMTLDDADFILELLNSPGWLKHLGDRGVNDLDQARSYLQRMVIPAYEKFGFGFYVIERLSDSARVGNCGLVKRLGLDHVDIGYSLLEQYEGQGYAIEAAKAMLDHGFQVLKLNPIQAITSMGNEGSKRVLEKLGMSCIGTVRLPDDDEELLLFNKFTP